MVQGITTFASSDRAVINRALDDLSRTARAFARLGAHTKAELLRRCIGRLVAGAPGWIADGCRAKGLGPDRAGEEWLSGPVPVVRMARLMGDSLETIAKRGKPALGTGVHTGPAGRLAIDLFPASSFDSAMVRGFSGYALMQEGIDREEAARRQAAFYERINPEGAVSLVLGAGNVSSIPAMDVFGRMFIGGEVCLLKMNPVNEWLGRHLERALDPLIAPGYLRIVYGGADVGHDLVHDDRIDAVHITGATKTHDLIVWGPPGPDRDRRIAMGDPLLKKPITSELGNVSPVAIVPYRYAEHDLEFQARNVVTMMTNNAAFNCNAAAMVITSASWPQRELFFDLIGRMLSRIAPRKAYYPGARQRYERLTGGGERVQHFGSAGDGELAWALIRDVDSRDTSNPLFQTEPFCGLLAETAMASDGPIDFLDAATVFMNGVLWGTLNACIVIAPALERDPAVAAALDRALVGLRYGTIGINHWPAVGYGAATMPWGGHPSATLDDIQSGLGWVHNTFMLDAVDKSVIRGPLHVRPTPVWFSDNRWSTAVGPRLVRFESQPRWIDVPGLMLTAIRT